MENRWPPDSVKSLLTPWLLRRCATSRPPWTWVWASVSVDMSDRTLQAANGMDTGRLPDAQARDLLCEATRTKTKHDDRRRSHVRGDEDRHPARAHRRVAGGP